MIGTWMKQKVLDHIHEHFGGPASSVGMIASKIFPITYSMTIHGPDEFYEVGNCYLSAKIDAAQFVCCIGSFARSQLMTLAPPCQWDKFKVVPLGVDPLKFVPQPARERSGPFEILCVGRLVPAKGQHILVSALKRLVDEDRSVRLRLLGDGPDRATLEQRIREERLQEHVIIEGAINQDRVPDFLKRADVFALASFAEGIPVALMEAMAMEIPCVSTMIAGIPELIRDEIDGLLVPPSDDKALAAALRRLMDNPELCRRLGAAARERVIERFNLKKNVGALAEVYRCQLPQQS
jgi:glycosyltransferase involved in cell wall biosynthesis